MASSGSMRRWLLCSLLCALGVLQAQENPEKLLSALKRKSLDLQLQKNAYDSDALEFGWINPITLRYSDSRNDQFDRTQKSRQFAVTVDQPIFKSGGIWAAIKYAGATRTVGDLSVESSKRALIKQVVATLFNFRKNRYQIQKQKLLIENDRLDVLRKKEQYLSGDLDSGFLDQAILQKNSDTMLLYNLQDSRAQLEKRFKDLSDADATTIPLPHFRLMSRSRFLAHHIDLARQQKIATQKEVFKTMTWSRYLPMVSLEASYIKPFENSYYFTGSRIGDMTDSYWTYGFRVSMPIDVNAYANIESARVDDLHAKTVLLDMRREAANQYRAAMKRLKVLDRKIALSIEDEKLYSSLVESTKEKVAAGELTEYDLKTMENSRKIRILDRKIYELDKQLVLLDLYEKSYDDTLQ